MSQYILSLLLLYCDEWIEAIVNTHTHTPLTHLPHSQLYGGAVASKVLTVINRLCVYYLKWCGHTISVKEFVTPKSVSEWRRLSLGNLVEVCRHYFIPF